MVVRRPVLLLLIFLALVGNVLAAPSFTSSLTSSEIELGKYTNLVLTSNRLTPSLRTVNLSALEEQFFVDTSAEVTSHGQQQQWQLRLYPRYSGKLHIPALTYGEISVPVKTLMVTPAMDSISGHRLTIDSTLSHASAWANQQVLISLSVITADNHVVLETTVPTLTSGTFNLIETHTTPIEGQALFRHRIGWAFFPAQTGLQALHLPPIYYRRDGINTHSFYPPLHKINVKPLPVYVPGNYPVGKLTIEVSPVSFLSFTNTLQTLRLNLHAEGIPETKMPHIENYLHGPQGLQLYPADTNTTQVSNNGIVSQAHVQVPFKATQTGLLKLNDIQLHYFDPESGKIRNLEHQWPTIFFISPWLLAILGLLVLTILAIALRRLYRFTLQWLQQYQCWQLARQRLLTASTPQDIKTAIMLMSKAEKGSDNITVQSWHHNKNIDATPLSLALYRQSGFDMQQLKASYLRLCPRRFWFTG